MLDIILERKRQIMGGPVLAPSSSVCSPTKQSATAFLSIAAGIGLICLAATIRLAELPLWWTSE